MKKIVLLCIVLSVIVGIVLGFRAVQQPQAAQNLISNISEQVESSQNETQLIGTPKRILISKIGVDAIIEQVQKDSLGRMAVPKEWNNTGWYSPGPKPGEIGNATIDGHVDNPSGNPSVFADLPDLNSGDVITIVDAHGNELQFSVTETQQVDLDDFPLQRVFGKTNEKQLNLITCGGEWDKNKKEYRERFIVYSKLIE